MSWWDTSHLTSLASTALKSAQKRIDKVLDIPVEEDTHNLPKTSSADRKSKSSLQDSGTWSSWSLTNASKSSSPSAQIGKESALTSQPLPSGLSALLETTIDKQPADESTELPAAPKPEPLPTAESLPKASTVVPVPRENDDQMAVQLSIVPGNEPPLSSPIRVEDVLEARGSKERYGRRRTSEKTANQPPRRSGPPKLGAVKISKEVESSPSTGQSLEAVFPRESTAANTGLSDQSTENAIHSNIVCNVCHRASNAQSQSQSDRVSCSCDNQLNKSLVYHTEDVDGFSSSPDLQSLQPQDVGIAQEPDLKQSQLHEPSQLMSCEQQQKQVPYEQLQEQVPCSEPQTLPDEHIPLTGQHPNPSLSQDPCIEPCQSRMQCSTLVLLDQASQSATDAGNPPSQSDKLDMLCFSPDLHTPQFYLLEQDVLHINQIQERSVCDSVGAEEIVVDAAEQSSLPQSSLARDNFVSSPTALDRESAVKQSADLFEANIAMVDEKQGLAASASFSNVCSEDCIEKSSSSDGTVVDQLASGSVLELSMPAAPDIPEERNSPCAAPSDYPADNMQASFSSDTYVKCDIHRYPRTTSTDDLVPMRGTPTEFSDFETGTSSDIEIISMASTFSMYGEGNGEPNAQEFIPLRGVFKTNMRQVSPDSSSQNSPSSDRDSSESPTNKLQAMGKQAEQLQPFGQHDPCNPLDSQTLLKKLAHLAEVLEVRETKLLTISKDNAELLEVNAHLRRRIEQMEEKNGDLNHIKEEFTERLHDMEKKLQNALREKDSMKKQVLAMQDELQNRTGTSDKMQRLVEEKDEQISALMQEGEKLAKQQLQSNNLIKKLRTKEKEHDEISRVLRERNDSQKSELERLKTVLDSKMENETKHTDLIKQLNAAVLSYQSEASKLRTEAEEAVERVRRAESALDNSYKEMAELHKSSAAKDTIIREMKQNCEQEVKERLQLAQERQQKDAFRDAHQYITQIEDLQLSMARLEREHARREDALKQEMESLQSRLEGADRRNDDLTQAVMSATRPLLRQIENMQSSFSAQSTSWERVEKNLSERLAEAQLQLAAATEKERQSHETVTELSAHVNTLESHLSSVKQEKTKVMAELEVYKVRNATLQEERNNATMQLEAFKLNLENDLIGAKKTNTLLTNQLELEKAKVETERKKVQMITEQLQDKDQELQACRRINAPSPSLSGGDLRATANTIPRAAKQDELLERALSSSRIGPSLYESMRQGSSTSLIDSLESQLKLREGEINQLQADIAELEKTRESLTKELVRLTEENRSNELRIQQLTKVQQQHKELSARYNALLQMYGEKEEEVTELRMDLMDVKEMYKQQIDALLVRK